ncbi:Cof-type HAD-IIB family hydrolase [Longibaculum muris]|uniref:Cof-type HAD-IIB family hydrolase n=1 Tax=Longibaculum muris TaxID=1796628 RepID=UPI0012B8FCFA|nr:Cof-type HAD-IIB family hydrolase [Longibaculum muris]
MYKMILSDLDETLLVNHHVPKVNQEAIFKAKEKGVKFVPATGRAFNMIGEILQEIDNYQKEDEYSICFNGGLIVENKDAKILSFQGLPFDLAKEMFEVGKNFDVCVMIFTLDCCYIFNADPDEVERKTVQKARFEVIDEYNMDFLKDDHIAKLLYEKRDMDYLKGIEKQIQSHVEGRLAVSYSSYRYLEFNPIGVSKGAALKWLADYLHMDIQETIAIGDNYNDTSMIKAAGLGVCVSSATEDIQAMSDYVTKADYDQGAVAEVIEKFVEGGQMDGL